MKWLALESSDLRIERGCGPYELDNELWGIINCGAFID
jgi:hypothetical protein